MPVSSAAIGGGAAAGTGVGRSGRRGLRGCRHRGQGALPCGDAPGGQHAQAERERLAARVQGSMTQLFVAGVQPAAGSTSLAGIQAGAWVSSRVAR
jgi:hypothetical protein